MIKQVFLSSAIASVFCMGVTFADKQSSDRCSGSACFSQIQLSGNNKILQNAKRYAWRPGHHNSGSRSSSNSRRSFSSGSWFINVPSKGPANSRGTIVFNPRQSTFAAYDSSGNLVKSGRASGGMGWCEDVGRSCRTPVGTFRVFRKGPADCVSNKYPLEEGGGAPMPHCMYFRGGYAIHGSYYVPNRPASHGCIRVTPANAEWLHRNFVRIGTVVRVKNY